LYFLNVNIFIFNTVKLGFTDELSITELFELLYDLQKTQTADRF